MYLTFDRVTALLPVWPGKSTSNRHIEHLDDLPRTGRLAASMKLMPKSP